MMRAISNIIWSIVSFEPAAGGPPLTIRRSARAKVMRLRVDPRTRTVLLTVPRRVSEKRALAWAAEQRGWIEAALADVPDAVPIAPGSVIPFLGEPHIVDWHPEASRAVRIEPGRIVTGGPRDTLQPRLLRWLREHARKLLDEETRLYAQRAGVTVTRVGVGDPLSRWGSCSSTGAIRYSWRLILAPDWVRRATVAHEVAHRVHMNHGAAFHALVEQLLGSDPSPARRWLRRHGTSIQRFGRL